MQCARTGTGLFFLSVILWRFTRARHQELVPMAGLHGGCTFQFLKITKMFSRVTASLHIPTSNIWVTRSFLSFFSIWCGHYLSLPPFWWVYSDISSVMLVCVSPVTGGVGRPSPQDAICMSSTVRGFLFYPFLLHHFLLWNSECSLYILNTSLLSELWFANIFSDGLLKSKIFNFGEA